MSLFLIFGSVLFHFYFHSRPGMYYFMTESSDLGKHHYCVVHVRETQREYRVDIMDRSFQPMILLIEEGDRVWWSWDKQKVSFYYILPFILTCLFIIIAT